MWPLVLLYAFEYMHGDEGRNQFFAFFIMTYGVTLGVCFSSDMITMYLFFEMLTLVTIPLVSHYGNHESMYAGRLYAAYTIGGASLGFMAVVLTTVYGKAGMFLYGGSIDGTYDDRMLYLAFILAFIGFGAKAAVFPLHNWLPMASVAPTPVTALLHAVAVVNSGVFAVMRITYYVFGEAFLKGTAAQAVCLALAIFSLLFGAAQAIRERHFKRRLAYSTMSNLSYMLLAAMAMSPQGLKAGLTHLVFHGIIKISLFMCAGAFIHRTRNSYIYEINGVGRRMPFTFAAYTLCALSLTGIPPLCGFVSKWQLMTAGMDAAATAAKEAVPDSAVSMLLPYLFYAGVAALIIAAFLCAMYSINISIRAFFPVTDKDLYKDSDVKEAGPLMLIPIYVFGACNILIGLFPGPILAILTAIGEGRL
jgi:multicomponent Na+:H+ antiporter subunit D